MLPRISVIFTSSPLSCVLKRWPSSVGVNAVQKPEVLDAISDLNEVVIKATKGTTQIIRMMARIMCANERLYITNQILSVPVAFARAEYANQEKSCEV